MITIKSSLPFKKNTFERQAWGEKTLIAGIDEAGRGCLAGPVVAAAVILPFQQAPSFLKDSKVMSQPQRAKAYTWITHHCLYSVGISCHTTIDRYNIWHASLSAMKKAALHLQALCPTPCTLFLIDAMPLSFTNPLFDASVTCHYFTHGEEKSSSIAAASIIAKVTRDRLMVLYDHLFPLYNLAQHKGYSTPAHKTLVTVQGISPIHRTTFSPCAVSKGKKHDTCEQ